MTEREIAFVRTQMAPQQPPPAAETGAIKWVRENLFSSWLNGILTILSILALWWIVAHIVPWAWNGIWSGTSLTECRAIRDAAGFTHDVACWAVIKERWMQILFGFYPADQIWRSLLALAIFALAVAPVLATSLPRQLLAVTAVAPFLCYWLLWGGSIWAPISVAMALVAGYAAYRLVLHSLPALAAFAGAAAALLWLWFGAGWMSRLMTSDNVEAVSIITVALAGISARLLYVEMRKRFDFAPALVSAILGFCVVWAALGPLTEARMVSGFGSYPTTDIGMLRGITTREFGGFQLSFIIGVAGITLSLPLGILLALGRQSDLMIVRWIAVGFIEIIRGVPLIVWLFTASLLLNYFLPPGTNFDLMLRVIIMVTLFAAAYIAEVVRGGLAALPKGQYEAADALGLDYWKSMRLIILPQALKISIPGIVNTFIGMFKDTTLVVFIGLLDPVGLTNSIRANQAWNGIYWELFIFIGALFFVVCFSMSRYSMYLERKLARDRR